VPKGVIKLRTKEFINRCLLKGVQITPSSDDDKILERYKAITEYFIFPCDFRNGVCGSRTDPRCCCQWCDQEIGYLKSINLKSLRKYAEAFSAKTGFWRQKVGCILSRNLRSTTCVSFICNSTYDKFRYSNYIEVVIFICLLGNYHNLLYGERLELQKIYKMLKVEYNNKIERGGWTNNAITN